MKSKITLYLLMLTVICISWLTGSPLYSQTGDPETDKGILEGKTSSNNYLVFGYSYPTSNNKLVLNNGTISLNFASVGWYKDDGSHAVTNPNYIAGFSGNSFRNFFSIDLNGITVPITNAVLQIQKFTSVPATGYAVWQLSDVTTSMTSINTDYSSALGNLSDGLAIYDDLGNGILFGVDTINANLPASTIITAVLNSSAIAALNAAIGGSFIIGGKVDSHFAHLPPLATTASATNVQSNEVQLNGMVNPRGTPTSVSFLYGIISGNLTSEIQALQSNITGNINLSVNAIMTGLTDNTVYYFKVKAVNSDLMVVYGQEFSFKTTEVVLIPPAPIAFTPQNFCMGSTISDLIAQPPAGCIVNWFDSPVGGNLLPNATELISGTTYYAESYKIVPGLSSLTRSPVTTNINEAPLPVISGSNTGCLNSGHYYYSTNPGMTNYHWTITDGGEIESGAGSENIVVSWNSTGDQILTLSYNSPEGCEPIEPAILIVRVDNIPDIPQVIIGSPQVCAGSAGIQYSTPPLINTETYVWQLPAGASIQSGTGTNSILVTFSSDASSGAVTVYGQNSCGSGEISHPFDVIVTPFPEDPGIINGPSSVCQGESMAIYYVQAINSATEYVWTIPPGANIISGANTNAIKVSFSATSSSGNVNVQGTNPCGEGNVSENYPVTVNEIPAPPEITIIGNILQSSAPDGNQWYIDGLLIPDATKQEYQPTQNGRYWSDVTLGGCRSDTSNNIDFLLTGIKETKESSFQINPVPNDGQFRIKLGNNHIPDLTIKVYNNFGKVIFEKDQIQWDAESGYFVDLGSVSAGTYAVVLQNDKIQIVKNMLIKR
jgi:hypothetical protein